MCVCVYQLNATLQHVACARARLSLGKFTYLPACLVHWDSMVISAVNVVPTHIHTFGGGRWPMRDCSQKVMLNERRVWWVHLNEQTRAHSPIPTAHKWQGGQSENRNQHTIAIDLLAQLDFRIMMMTFVCVFRFQAANTLHRFFELIPNSFFYSCTFTSSDENAILSTGNYSILTSFLNYSSLFVSFSCDFLVTMALVHISSEKRKQNVHV